mgnify:CR=1 FL=1
MAKILLIRHGETDWNKEKRLQGHLDIGLNDTGIEQARLLGRVLSKEKIDLAYSSDLSRALATANAITQHHDIPVYLDRSLRERCYGEIEGMTYAEIEEKLPDNHKAWHGRNVDFRPNKGESLRDFYERVAQGATRIAKSHLGQTIVMVAHGGVLDCMYRLATEMSLEAPRHFDLLNTSLNRLSFDGERFHLESWGDVSHLNAEKALDELDGSQQASVPWSLP